MILPPQRAAFDIPDDICYLNTSYISPLTKAQVRAGEQSLARSAHPWDIGAGDFFTAADDIRQYAGALTNVGARDFAIVPSASYGIATAALNLPLEAGQGILLLEAEFPSNYYAWQELAGIKKARLVTVPEPENHDWTSSVLDTLEREQDQIGVVALGNVHWSSGAVLDLRRISAVCKEIGAALVLDLSQSLGAMPTDLAAIDPDFAVSAGYKWLLAPYGISLLYVAPRWQSGVSIEQGWISRKNSEDFARLVSYQPEFQPGALRFDMGERANLVLAPIFLQGLKQLNEWGTDNIADTLRAVNQRLAALLAERGFTAIDDRFRAPHMLGVQLGEAAPRVLEVLTSKKVFASVRGDMLRLSPHLWVTEEDEARFAAALRAI